MASPPIHTIRLGLIKASIRRKRTSQGFKFTVTVARLYRNGDEWKQSTRFAPGDIPRIRLVLDFAQSWIFEHNSDAT